MDLPDNALKRTTLGLIHADLIVQNMYAQGKRDWRADGSLTLATIAALSRSYNLYTIMERFVSWYRRGTFTALGKRQPVGPVTELALKHYIKNHDPFSSGVVAGQDQGNAALLRITPMVLYLHAEYGPEFVNNEPAMLSLHQVTGLTHNQPLALMTNGFYAMLVNQLLEGQSLQVSFERAISQGYDYYARHHFFAGHLAAFNRLNLPDFKHTPQKDILASDQALDTLEAAIWVVFHSQSYQEALNLTGELGGHPARVLPLVGSLSALLFDDPVMIPDDWLGQGGLNQIKRILMVANRVGAFNPVNL